MTLTAPRRWLFAVLAAFALTAAAAPAHATETRIPTTVHLMAHYGHSAPGIPNVFYASVVADGPVAVWRPGGTINFRVGDTVLASFPADVGHATLPITLPTGDHVVSVDFSGNDHLLPGTGSIVHRVISNDALSGVPRPTPPPAPAPVEPPPPAAPSPVEEPPPPAPAPAPALVPKPEIRAGVREITAIALTPRAAAFSQRIAAPGTITWTVEARGGGTGVLATATRHVQPGVVPVSLPYGAAARAHLREHPNARIVLRTQLALDDGRALRSSRRLSAR